MIKPYFQDSLQTYTALNKGTDSLNAFGMVMPERSFSNEKYRYGFNGKENDNEVKGIGNSVDFGARIYDSRLGRFLSIDPLFAKYAWNSPYAFAENRVIDGIDINGKGWGDFLKPLAEVVVSKIQVVVKDFVLAGVVYVKEEINKIEVTPYLKAEAKYSVGARVAGQVNKSYGGDLNGGSVEIARVTVEVNRQTINEPSKIVQGNIVGKDGKATITMSASGNATTGVVGAGAGSGYSKTISKDGNVQETKSANSGGSVGPVNGTLAVEQTTDTEQSTTTTTVTGSVGHGGSYGIIGTVDYTFEGGVKLSFTKEE